MKTIKLVTCALLLGIITSNAQENQNQGIEFGIKGGINLTKFRKESSKFKTGLIGGLFIRYQISEKFTFQSEALYSVQGAKSKNTSNKIKLNYITVIPALVKFFPINKLSLEAGPQIGYLLGGKGQGFQKNNYKKIDYGAAIGVGYAITPSIEIGVRYNLGLANISKVSNTSLKNSVFQASASLKL